MLSDSSISSEQNGKQMSDPITYDEYNRFASSQYEASYSRSFPGYISQQVSYQNIESTTSGILRNSSCDNLQFGIEDQSKIDRIPTNTEAKENSIPRVQKRKKSMPNYTRKRKINKLEWIDVKAKAARNFGIEGTGRKGLIKARKMKDGCPEKCRNKCRNKINSEERLAAFNKFWALGDHTKQWSCLSKWVTKQLVEKKDDSDSDYEMKSDGDDNEKSRFKHIFTLPKADDQAVIVCKKMFLQTLGIQYYLHLYNQKVRKNYE